MFRYKAGIEKIEAAYSTLMKGNVRLSDITVKWRVLSPFIYVFKNSFGKEVTIQCRPCYC